MCASTPGAEILRNNGCSLISAQFKSGDLFRSVLYVRINKVE